jgi:hypothetical protein
MLTKEVWEREEFAGLRPGLGQPHDSLLSMFAHHTWGVLATIWPQIFDFMLPFDAIRPADESCG